MKKKDHQTNLWLIALLIFLFSLLAVLLKGGEYSHGWFDFETPVELPKHNTKADIPLIQSLDSQDIAENKVLNFIYASPEGYYVGSCMIYYPEGTLLQEIIPEGKVKVLTARSDEFSVIEGKNSVYMNCSNINLINPSDIVYEYEILEFQHDSFIQKFLSHIPIWLLVLVNVVLIVSAMIVTYRKK